MLSCFSRFELISFRRSFLGLRVFTLSILGMSLFWNHFAFAYIPPSQFIVKTWVSKHKGLKSVRIKSTVTALENGRPTDIKFKEVTQFIADKQTLRSWALDDAERKLFVGEKWGLALSPVSKLLLSSNLPEVMRVLKDNGVPVKTEEELMSYSTEAERIAAETETMGRINNSIAWIIGTGSSGGQELTSPQVWFEKDSFLPLRLVFGSTQTQETYDVRMESYRHYKEIPFPRTVSVSKKGKGLILSSQVSEILINPEPSVLKQMSSGSENGFTEVGKDSSGALKDLIRLYYDVVR